MGLFDKIGNVAKEAKENAGSLMQSAKNTASSAKESIAAKGDVKNDVAKYKVPFIDLHTTIPVGEEQDFTVEPIVGTEQTFNLSGITFSVPAKIDAHNQYMKAMMPYQQAAYERFNSEYLNKVKDAPSYFEIVPVEYDKNLYPLLKRATAYLMSANVWDVTYEQFTSDFKKHASFISDEWAKILELVNEMIESDPELQGAKLGAGLFDAVGARYQQNSGFLGELQKTLWETTVSSKAEQQVEQAREAAGLTEEQLANLYESIQSTSEQFCANVQSDYNRVAKLLIVVLRQHGADIWLPDDDEKKRANNILANLQNADLSQPNAVKALTEVILADPYNGATYAFMERKLDNKDEIEAIKNYFGV